MSKFKLNISEESIKYLIIYLGIIMSVILLGIIPLYKSNNNLNKDIEKMKYQIEEQKSLGNFLSVLTKSIKNKDLKSLPNPRKTTIPFQDVSKFQDEFRTKAIKSGLITILLTPDYSTFTVTSQYLSYNAVIKGEFVNFRKLLIELSGISYLDEIEEINIQQYSDYMEFRMKVWIALGSR